MRTLRGMDTNSTTSRTLILIDPTSPAGEAGLDLVGPDDTAVTLLLTLDGRSAAALREFAVAEDIDVSMAGLIYLDQVVGRLAAKCTDVETISTTGTNALHSIFEVVQRRIIDRVIIPASLPGLTTGSLGELVQACPVPVIVVPNVDRTYARIHLAS